MVKGTKKIKLKNPMTKKKNKKQLDEKKNFCNTLSARRVSKMIYKVTICYIEFYCSVVKIP